MSFTAVPGFDFGNAQQGYIVQNGQPVFGTQKGGEFIRGDTALTPELRAQILAGGGGGQQLQIPFEQIFGPENLNSTVIQDLPDWLRGPAQDYLAQAQRLSQMPASQGIAPFTSAERMGQALGINRARGDSRFINPLNNEALRTLRGDYLNPNTNPYLHDTYNQAASRVGDQFMRSTAPSIQAGFNQAGAFGGSAMNQTMGEAQEVLGDQLNRLATDIYGGNYDRERVRQFQQQSLIPQILRTQQIGPDVLQNIGATQRGMDQSMRDWPFTSNDYLGSAIGAVRPGFGSGTTTSPNPAYTSPFQMLLGLGGFNSMGNMGFGGAPFGFGGGTGLGF